MSYRDADNRGFYKNPYTDIDDFAAQRLTGSPVLEDASINDSIVLMGGLRTPLGVIQKSVGNIIDAQRLEPFNAAALPVDDPRITRKIPQASYSPSQYGDMILIPVNIVAGVDLLVLPRPAKTRIHLIIQNTLAANVLYYMFDNPASVVNGLQIQPGGNAFYDQVVPQNDLHLFSAVSGVIMLGYINADIANGV